MTTARSDKPFKFDEHRAERSAVRATIMHSPDDDSRALYSKVYGNPWEDGKRRRMVSNWSIPALDRCGNEHAAASEFIAEEGQEAYRKIKI
jgi:hypothetical protein